MDQFYFFFVIIIAAILFSTLFRKLHFPWVVTLIMAGVIIGPFGLGILEVTEVVEFFGQCGLVLLMFMAGLETKLSTFKQNKKGIVLISLFASVIPFISGYGVSYLFGFDFVTSLLLGIIFISSSIAVIVPSMEANGIMTTKIGKTTIAAAVIADILSLLMLSVVLQTQSTGTQIPLLVFYPLLFGLLFLMRWLIPLLRTALSSASAGEADLFQKDIRIILAIMMGTVLVFEFMGLHPIIAGFFVGLTLSDSIKSIRLKEKIHTISYGIFIPVFFVIVGANTDVTILKDAGNTFVLIFVVISALIASKVVGGMIGGRLAGFSRNDSTFIGISLIPQLSTTLAVVYTGSKAGLVPVELEISIIALSVVTVIIAPMYIRSYAKQLTVDPRM